MSESGSACCVILPCSSELLWVVPQRCLGEIVTVPTEVELPPDIIEWRGELVPVVDFGVQDSAPWRDPRGGTGLVVVILGQRDESCRFFAVAVRGSNLAVCKLAEEEIEDLPGLHSNYAAAAFRMNGNVYQVPDLLALQRALGSGVRPGQCAT